VTTVDQALPCGHGLGALAEVLGAEQRSANRSGQEIFAGIRPGTAQPGKQPAERLTRCDGSPPRSPHRRVALPPGAPV
jgi:hypothetical protein